MKKRLLSLVMVLALVLSLCPTALAAGTEDAVEGRETHFFDEKTYNDAKRAAFGDRTFDDIVYEDYRMDWDEFYSQYDGIYDLMYDAAENGSNNTDAIAEDFAELCGMIEMTWTMERFTSLQGYLNYSNDDAWDDYYDNYTGSWEWVSAAYDEEMDEHGVWAWIEGEYVLDENGYYIWVEAHYEWVPATYDDGNGNYYSLVYYYGPYWYTWDYFYYLVHDLLTAGYEDILAPYFPSNDRTDYRCLDYYWPDYEEYYDYDVNAGLLSDYQSFSYWKDWYVSNYGEDYYQDTVGGIYIQMVKNWNDSVADTDYKNYMEYVYASYGRDYTPEEIREFETAVKEYLVPVYLELRAKNDETLDMSSAVFTADYTTDETLESLRPYLADMSSELAASFDYMIGHGMYDIQAAGAKYYGGAFTDRLYSFGTPFLFSDPYTGSNNMINFTTNVHEFGHYNAMFYDPLGWLQLSKADDIMETHSQGLELLMTHYYPQIFGEDAEAVTSYFMEYFLGTLVWQCLRDEFEQYAFTAAAEGAELTVQSLNRKYYALEVEYGIISAENVEEDGEDASWMDINHFFSYPCYLISYATSLSGAFSFWLEGQDEFYGAVDAYLEFCALSVDDGFQESFAAVGVENPVSADYVGDLAAKLTAALLTEKPEPTPSFPVTPIVPPSTTPDTDTPATTPDEGGPAVSFTDVPANAWYCDAVDYVVENGLMNGVGSGKFAPELNITRGMIVTTLYRLEGEPAVSGTSGFADVPAGAWYADAVVWAASNGIVNGYGGAFSPDGDLTRQDMAVILYRYAQYKGDDVSVGEDTNILSYADAESISGYAIPAMQWACGSGIIEGTGSGALNPRGGASRAELATILMRVDEL